jgi:hypothetical protein
MVSLPHDASAQIRLWARLLYWSKWIMFWRGRLPDRGAVRLCVVTCLSCGHQQFQLPRSGLCLQELLAQSIRCTGRGAFGRPEGFGQIINLFGQNGNGPSNVAIKPRQGAQTARQKQAICRCKNGSKRNCKID